jgi:hypothetical protein
VLSFAHRGFAQADEGYARVTTGWGYYLVSLQLYLETGKGDGEPWPALGEVMAGIADTLNVRAILVERRSKSERGLSRKTYLQRVFRTSRRPTLRHAADDIGDVNGPRPRCRAPRQPRSQRGGRGGARSWNGRGAGEAECCSQEIAARQI